jgi:hypothetical protein
MRIIKNNGTTRLEGDWLGLNLDDMMTDPDGFEIPAHNLHLMSRYANLKAQAIRARLSISIERALIIEKQMEEVYEGLADWAKW